MVLKSGFSSLESKKLVILLPWLICIFADQAPATSLIDPSAAQPASAYLNSSIPGINPARLLRPNGTAKFEDGRNCQTGQEAWSPEEAAIVGNTIVTTLGSGIRGETIYQLVNTEKDSEWSLNCRSAKCYLDGRSWTWTCGSASFEDGLSCGYGLRPRKESEVDDMEREEYLAHRGDVFLNEVVETAYHPPHHLSRGQLEEEADERAQLLMGRNCKSGRCYFDWETLAAVCGAGSARAPFILLWALLGACGRRALLNS